VRNDIRQNIVDMIIEYRKDNPDVVYKDFLFYLRTINEFNLRAHVVQNKFMFGSMVREAIASQV
jgi:hypothetical protein